MRGDGYAVIGLAGSRSEWLRSLARWSTSATIPVDFVACVSISELLARFNSGERYSAALIDHKIAGLDRDVIALMRNAGCAPIVVGTTDGPTWEAVGASVLGERVSPESIMAALRSVAAPMDRWDAWAELEPRHPPRPAQAGGVAVAVCGPGGTGVSTLAIAAAQGLARKGGPVVLCDFVRRAQQGMLHDTYDVRPALPEVVDGHRMGSMTTEEIIESTFVVKERGYRLLLGIRHPGAWTAMRPLALDAAFAALGLAFSAIVVDADLDLEGEAESGSMDVQERNGASRTAIGRADVVVVVGNPGIKGLHSLVGAVGEVIGFGVDPARVVAVINRAPRNPLSRAELASAYRRLVKDLGTLTTTVHSPHRSPRAGGSPSALGDLALIPDRSLERALRDVAPLPEQVVAPLCAAIEGARTVQHERAGDPLAPQRILPHRLGHWEDPDGIGMPRG